MLLYEGDQEQCHRELLDKIRVKEAELHTIRESAKRAILAAMHPASKSSYFVCRPESRNTACWHQRTGDYGSNFWALRHRAFQITATSRFLFDDVQPGGGNSLVAGEGHQSSYRFNVIDGVKSDD